VSDLQCPARFLLVPPQEEGVAGSLRLERVAAVYDAAGAAAGAGALARELGVPARPCPAPVRMVDVRTGAPEALAVLADLADLHRGESVVVLAEGAPGERLEASLDDDGVRLR
jgi:hypothetical protein